MSNYPAHEESMNNAAFEARIYRECLESAADDVYYNKVDIDRAADDWGVRVDDIQARITDQF